MQRVNLAANQVVRPAAQIGLWMIASEVRDLPGLTDGVKSILYLVFLVAAVAVQIYGDRQTPPTQPAAPTVVIPEVDPDPVEPVVPDEPKAAPPSPLEYRPPTL